MRHLNVAIGMVVTLSFTVHAGIFGDSSSTTPAAAVPSASSSSPSSSTASASAVSAEVIFLQMLQQAQIASMDCLITLVNMTQNPIGTCLGLNNLATLIVNPSFSANNSADFSSQLNGYLTTICAAKQCTSEQLSTAESQLSSSCGSGSTANTSLVGVLSKVMSNYAASYRTLACSVHFNGTAPLCLADTLSSSTTSNTNSFFNALISGSSLSQYASILTEAKCTGCMYEMYKAAVYTIPEIRGQNLTNAMGDHLKNDCSGTATGNTTVNWSDVQDQQIPDALQVSQSTPVAKSGTLKTTDEVHFSLIAGAGTMLALGLGAGWSVLT